MLSSIMIYRSYPVINGFVQLPINRSMVKQGLSGKQHYKSIDLFLSSVPDSDSKSLSLGSGPCTGSKFGAQRFVTLPPVSVNQWYESDPADTEL